MDEVVYKILSLCVITAVLVMYTRNLMPSYAPVICLCAGLVSIWILVPYIDTLISSLNNFADKINTGYDFIYATVKVVSVSILFEFASQLCCDMGEKYLSDKIDLGGKVIIVCMCVPYFINLVSDIVEMIEQV